MRGKRIFLSLAFIVVFGLYVIYEKGNSIAFYTFNATSATPTTALPQSSPAQPAPVQNTPVAIPPLNAGPMMGQSTPPMMQGKYKNGEYTGASANAYYGNVQVKAIISGGKLTDIQFLDYPQDNGSSLQRSNYALPQLKTEAITAQASNVDAVSGATETSRAFNESLSSALLQAS